MGVARSMLFPTQQLPPVFEEPQGPNGPRFMDRAVNVGPAALRVPGFFVNPTQMAIYEAWLDLDVATGPVGSMEFRTELSTAVSSLI